MTTTIIAIVISAVVCLFAILTFAFTRAKESKNASKEAAEAVKNNDEVLYSIKEAMMENKLQLNQIATTTTETRAEIKAITNKVNDHDKRLAVVERDVSTAFIRIDELKEAVK